MTEHNPELRPDNGPSLLRLSVLLNEEAAKAFKTLMAIEQVSATELERRMIAVYNLVKECELRGDQVIIREESGQERELKLLPSSPPEASSP